MTRVTAKMSNLFPFNVKTKTKCRNQTIRQHSTVKVWMQIVDTCYVFFHFNSLVYLLYCVSHLPMIQLKNRSPWPFGCRSGRRDQCNFCSIPTIPQASRLDIDLLWCTSRSSLSGSQQDIREINKQNVKFNFKSKTCIIVYEYSSLYVLC